jgi:hypothetical protein
MFPPSRMFPFPSARRNATQIRRRRDVPRCLTSAECALAAAIGERSRPWAPEMALVHDQPSDVASGWLPARAPPPTRLNSPPLPQRCGSDCLALDSLISARAEHGPTMYGRWTRGGGLQLPDRRLRKREVDIGGRHCGDAGGRPPRPRRLCTSGVAESGKSAA